MLVVLISFPFIGSLVYFGAEILPELLRSRTSQRAMRGIRTTLDPEGNLRKLETDSEGHRQRRLAPEVCRRTRAAGARRRSAAYLSDLSDRSLRRTIPSCCWDMRMRSSRRATPPAARKTLDDLIQQESGLQVRGRTPAVRARAGSRGRSVEGVV